MALELHGRAGGEGADHMGLHAAQGDAGLVLQAAHAVGGVLVLGRVGQPAGQA